MPMSDSEFIVLDVYGSAAEADILCGALRDGGVECFVRGDIVGTVMPFVPSSLGIVINRRDEAVARRILKNRSGQEDE